MASSHVLICLVPGREARKRDRSDAENNGEAGRQAVYEAGVLKEPARETRSPPRALDMEMERARPGRWSSCTWQKQESDQKRGGERQTTRTTRMMSVNKSRRRLARPLRTLAHRFFFLLFLFHLLSIHPLAPRPTDSDSDHSLTLLLTCSSGMSRDRN